MNKEDKREFRTVNFKRNSRTRNKKGYLCGLQELKRARKENKIVISTWFGHDKSFWVSFVDWRGNQQVFDSGTIEQLAEEIKRLKKTGLKKTPLDKIFVINSPKEFY